MQFQDVFPFETFQSLLISDNSNKPIPRDYGYQFREAVEIYLRQLQADGKLKPFRNGDNRNIPFVQFWNRFVASGDFSEEILLTLASDKTLLFFTFIEGDPQSNYGKLIDLYNSGTFQSFYLPDQFDFTLGESRYFRSFDWGFAIVHYEPGQGSVPDAPVSPEPEVYMGEIEFKTGHLVAADWFRMEEFNTFTDQHTDSSITLNSIHGLVNRTRGYLNAGFLHVFVGNSSPDIFVRDSKLIVGNVDYDNEPTDALGRITTDLWWCTIIEREKLARIVGEEKLQQYINSGENRIVEFTVEPGKYQFSFEGKLPTFDGIKNTHLVAEKWNVDA